MDATISNSTKQFEKSIKLLATMAGDPITRYNYIMKNYFDDNFMSTIGLGTVGGLMLSTAETVGSTFASIGLVSVVPGVGQVGGAVIAKIGPVIAAAIGGNKVGKAIGNVGLNIIDRAKQGKAELDKLAQDATTLKGYCVSLDGQLSTAIKNVKKASTNIDLAIYKISNMEYKTKEDNVKRMKERKDKLSTIAREMEEFRKVIKTIYANLSALI